MKMNELELMYEKFHDGEITSKEWSDYCLIELENFMSENKKVLENLK